MKIFQLTACSRMCPSTTTPGLPRSVGSADCQCWREPRLLHVPLQPPPAQALSGRTVLPEWAPCPTGPGQTQLIRDALESNLSSLSRENLLPQLGLSSCPRTSACLIASPLNGLILLRDRASPCWGQGHCRDTAWEQGLWGDLAEPHVGELEPCWGWGTGTRHVGVSSAGKDPGVQEGMVPQTVAKPGPGQGLFPRAVLSRGPWLETGTSWGPAVTGRWSGLELCSSTAPSSSCKQSPHPLVPSIHQCSSRPVPPSTLITLWISSSQSPGCPHCPCPPAVLLPSQCPLMPVSPVPEEEESVSACCSLKGLQRGQKQLCLESLNLRLHHLWGSPGE